LPSINPFALAKQIQWELPNTHGQDHLAVMFGALHVEMAASKALGKWLTVLHLLQHQAYSKFTEKITDDDDDKVMTIGIEEWKSQMSKKSPQFLYRSRVLDLELCSL